MSKRSLKDNDANTNNNDVNSKLPFKKLFPLGLQHVLAMYAGAVAVPLILGSALGLNAHQITFLIAADLFTCGLATLLQSFGIGNILGVKMPVILACSFIAVASVFDRYRKPLYKQASYKPYAIASMIFLSKVKNPQEVLAMLEKRNKERKVK